MNEQTWCPSSQPAEPEAVVLAVRPDPSRPLVYLDLPVPARRATAEVPEHLHPTEIMRFAGHCVSTCGHWQENACSLVDKIAVAVPAVEAGPLPRCHLRPRCRWWLQSGVDACRRCPAVDTFVAVGDSVGEVVADPAADPAAVRGSLG